MFEISNFYQVQFSKILNINGDTLHYHSENNSGGYHVQKVGVMNTTDETLISFLKDSFKNIIEIIGTKKK